MNLFPHRSVAVRAESWIALAALAFSGSVLQAAPKVEETIIGPSDGGGLYVVSQNEARIAYVGAKGTRVVVSVDGVEGPVLDELIGGAPWMGNQLLVHNANAGGKFNGTPTAVIFSEVGAHYAYVGRQGNEYLVIHDGKEVGRGARNDLALQHMPLGLSPTGRHVFWGEMKIENGRGTYRLIMDGKPEPWAGHQDLKPVFSPDDSKYAYLAGKPDDYKTPMLILNGKVMSYVGQNPQFTADNKLLLTAQDLKDVLVDGRPMKINAYIGVEKVVPAPVGGRFAIIVRKKLVNYQGVGTLILDGKEVANSDGATDITFSPDGKRWALRCLNPEARAASMMIDGKKGTEYPTVSEVAHWTPDSSKVIYEISGGGRNFVVVDTEEFAITLLNSLMGSPFAFAKTGNHYSFSSGDPSNRNSITIVDGKQVLPQGLYAYSDTFRFNDDGSQYAVVVGPIGRQGTSGIIRNGVLADKLSVNAFQKMGTEQERYFALSPDGKYLAQTSYEGSKQGLYINEKLVYTPSWGTITSPTFTPDSKHLFWIGIEKTGEPNTLEYVVYVDGEPAVNLTRGQVIGGAGTWQMDDQGVVTLLGANGGKVKRIRITASADSNIEQLFAKAEEARAKALAAAEAAKKKAEEDRLAAEAKAKADREAAIAAQKKAAADAQAARVEAANKKKLYLINKQRAKQGLPPLEKLP